jgi:hypothetical protein
MMPAAAGGVLADVPLPPSSSLYAVFLTLPLVIARILFFPDNPWVPNP